MAETVVTGDELIRQGYKKIGTLPRLVLTDERPQPIYFVELYRRYGHTVEIVVSTETAWKLNR